MYVGELGESLFSDGNEVTLVGAGTLAGWGGGGVGLIWDRKNWGEIIEFPPGQYYTTLTRGIIQI